MRRKAQDIIRKREYSFPLFSFPTFFLPKKKNLAIYLAIIEHPREKKERENNGMRRGGERLSIILARKK